MNTDYITLLQKIDAFAVSLSKKYPDDISCKKGCANCCVKNITVWQVEYDNIKSANKKHPLSYPDKCPYLNSDNSCSIYNVRPVVCRLWGLPVLYSNSSLSTENSTAPSSENSAVLSSRHALSRDPFSTIKHLGDKTLICCNLNFKDKLPDTNDMLNGDIILTTLAAINSVYCSKNHFDSEKRYKIGDAD